MLSVLGSVGFFSAVGVKSTLIIMEVIPFLVLAVSLLYRNLAFFSYQIDFQCQDSGGLFTSTIMAFDDYGIISILNELLMVRLG